MEVDMNENLVQESPAQPLSNQSYGPAPVLWNPGAAGAWSLIFNPVFGSILVLMNWQMAGYMMVIYIAAIQAISPELIEAAKIDGANAWQMLTRITVPLVMPAFTICTFLTVTNSFKLFDQNLALTAGAPARESAMLALDIFNTFYGRNDYEGVGQAKAVMFFLFVAAVVLLQLRFSRSQEVEN
jgi:raffinose/stachyose/melibiose transport system permease protein